MTDTIGRLSQLQGFSEVSRLELGMDFRKPEYRRAVFTFEEINKLQYKQSGIYAIICMSTNKSYIGSTVDLKSRFSANKCNLKYGSHCNPELQKDWELYGQSNFVFEILELVLEKELLLVREKFYIENCPFVYNKVEPGKLPYTKGLRYTHKNIEISTQKYKDSWTPERRKKQSEVAKRVKLGILYGRGNRNG